MSSPVSIYEHREKIQDVIVGKNRDLQGLIASLHDERGKFYFDEMELLDYKEEYPFSYSDSYFGGILRLVCAFHNTFGGLIVFGVNDKDRFAGKNKVIVDIEKINRKIRESLSAPISLSAYKFQTPSGQVDVILVPVRSALVPPVYFIKDISEYKAEVIYLRKNAEVCSAFGSDIQFLYSDRSRRFVEDELTDFAIPSSLPASPATISEFVGRFLAIENLVLWVQKPRSPRMFLWGQGGSGKSTIAYEFASLIANFGKFVKLKGESSLERVIFISGKSIELNSYTGKIEKLERTDFVSAQDIYRKLLILSGWHSSDQVMMYSEEQCLEALETLFDIETQLIVIDDIDTLTTSNSDAGMEELFLILSRAKSGSKILYTQRNYPSFAPNAALEVPSLNYDEMIQFIDLCCKKFGVPVPNKEEMNSIFNHSESRPLAVETIIAMRRRAPSYPQAFKSWVENSSEPRRYLFGREYQQLRRDDRSRHLLAALSIIGQPTSFEFLRELLQFTPEQLKSAIGECREMFLRIIQNGDPSGDMYSIGEATKLFLLENSKQLDRYTTIEARINIMKSKIKHTPPAIQTIILRADSYIRRGDYNGAIQILKNEEMPPTFREFPDVKALLGKALSLHTPPLVMEARECFESAFSLGYRKHDMYIAWLELERNNSTEKLNGIEICNKVISNSGFDAVTKATFQRKLAKYQSYRSTDLELTAPSEAIKLRYESVRNFLVAYDLAKMCAHGHLDSYFQSAQKSLYFNVSRLLDRGDHDDLFDFLEYIFSINVFLDPYMPIITGAIDYACAHAQSSKRAALARANKLNGKIQSIGDAVMSTDEKKNLIDVLKKNITILTKSGAR